MKRTFTIIIFSLLFWQSGSAQIAPESIAPDFTATDIYGQEYNLYELLDEGKTVILDIFATWCGPCWNYHTQHHLKDLFEEYGPDGTNEVYVFSIEGDGGTPEECIFGEGSGCMYDWTDETPYPIINSREIATDYQIAYYPTIFMVYPNRLVSEIGQLPKESIVELQKLAPTLSEGYNPVMLKDAAFNGSVCSALHQHTPYYLLSNYGEETITSATIEVFKNCERIYLNEWTGEVGSYGIIEEIRPPATLLRGNTTYEVKMSNINGDASESKSFFDQVTFETTSTLYVSVQTDESSAVDANYYEILNGDGTQIIFENINQASTLYENKHVINTTDCFEFKIYDRSGNGIDGTITVHDDAGNIIYNNDGFEFEDSNSFNVSALTSNKNVLDNVTLNVSPNPASDFVNLSVGLDRQETFHVSITNITGQTLLNKNSNTLYPGANTVSLNVSDLSNGVYFVKIENETGLLTKRLVIQK